MVYPIRKNLQGSKFFSGRVDHFLKGTKTLLTELTHLEVYQFPLSGKYISCLALLLLNMTYPVLVNRVDPAQLASKEANSSGSALFVIKYVNLYQKPGSSNLIGKKLEVGVASLFSMTRVRMLTRGY